MEIKKAYEYLVHALAEIYGASEAASITQILFEDAFGVTNPNKIGQLNEAQAKRFIHYTERLIHREPIQYILRQADFFGLKLLVNPDVLIPRQETEELVDWVLQETDKRQKIRILDIGTGSGCIALALKKQLPQAEIWAVDVSKSALAVARENARRLGLEVTFRVVDILDARQWDTLPIFDVVVSNPPYIALSEKSVMPDWVLEHEPHLALFSEQDALLFYKVIADFVQKNGASQAALFFELNEFNAPQVKTLLQEKKYSNIELREDLNGKQRMLRAVFE